MHIRGTVTGRHTTTLEGRRPKILTSVWIADRHDHTDRPSKLPSVLYEVQFLDTKAESWSRALEQFIDVGQRVIADINDTFELVHVERDSGSRNYIKARGVDIAASTLDHARAAAKSTP